MATVAAPLSPRLVETPIAPIEVEAPAAHKEITNREQFLAAIQTKDKYVLLYAYTGEVTPAAEAAAKQHAHNTDAYKVDVDKFPTCKENLKLTAFPAVVVFKDGKEIKRVEGVNKDNAKEVVEVLV